MTRDELLEHARHPNVRAMLDAIAACEGTAGPLGYRTQFGGGTFDSFADHPKQVIERTLGGKPLASSAAGRYQFLARTWGSLVEQYGFPSFEPQWQDAGAVALIEGRGALEDVVAGRLEAAVRKLAPEWASLPGAPYGQPTKHITFVRDVYLRAGGRLDGGAPVEARTHPNLHTHAPTYTEVIPSYPGAKKSMSPFILPALDALVGLIPTIADLFKGEKPSKVAERNLDAVQAIAERVMPIIVQASGQPNMQGAVEAAQADPKVAADIDAAARREYHELSRVAIKEAREFAVSYAQMHNVRTVIGRFTFLEFFTLLIVLLSALMVGGMFWFGLLQGELLGAVVTMVVVAGFVDARKFWLGLPASEPPSDASPSRER
jgi:muramidase (phage lysozyme)